MNKDEYEKLRRDFKAQFNAVGSTREQQVMAWKQLKWDPVVESLDYFAYQFAEMADSLGYNQDQQLETFLSCMPASMFVFVSNAMSIEDALCKLKRGMVFGTQPTLKPETKTVVPFIAGSNETVNFAQETILVDGLKSIKDSIRQDNDKLINV